MLIKSIARLKYLSIPPRKMRLVADLIKGMPVEKALGVLNFTPRIAAHHLAKTLKSAAANALSKEGTDHLKPEDLTVKRIVVDEAPTHKRVRFRSMGRIYRYRKRFCHLMVEVEGRSEMPVPKRTKAGAAKEAAGETKPVTGTAKAGKKTAAPKKTKKTAAKKTAVRKAGTKKATAGKKTTTARTKKDDK